MSGLDLWNPDKEEGSDMSDLGGGYVRSKSLESG
jgi:hypothetical protein